MIILKPPRTPWPILLVSWIAALIVAALIAHFVFTFGYYASGLAAYHEDERRRLETPIPLSFADPVADPNTTSPSPTRAPTRAPATAPTREKAAPQR